MRIGILGGGQLARMMALAGTPLGLRFRFFDTHADAPAGHVGELHVGSFEDHVAIDRFCADCDVITYEFENIPAHIVERIERLHKVLPGSQPLRIGQDRINEKTFFKSRGVDTHDFRAVSDRASFDAAIRDIGLPAVIKTTRMGYDGKGQGVAHTAHEAESLWTTLGASPLIVEKFVKFDRELSAIAVRSVQGEVRFYDWTHNTHRGGILRVSRAGVTPADPQAASRARETIAKAMSDMNYVGVMAVELFEVGGRLLFNESAPRVHNSSHWTMDGARCGQFENHCRAVAGLPLGDVTREHDCAMVNLIGRLPSIESVAAIQGAHIHYYGKAERAGRKVGHINIVRRGDMTVGDFERSVTQAITLAEDSNA